MKTKKYEALVPDGWRMKRLGTLANIISPGFPCGDHNKEGIGVPHLRPMNISEDGEIDLSELKYVNEDYNPLRKGDVLFNNTNSPRLVGKTALIRADQEWAFSNHMTRIAGLSNDVEPAWLAYWMNFLFKDGYFRQNCSHHVNQASIGTGFLEEHLDIPIPPKSEQRHIVSKIEELFSNLDAGLESLTTVKRELERYRLSVLQAAVDGRLTTEWRQTHSPEPPDRLAERILEKHREAWEERYLEKYQSRGRSLPSNWRSRYDVPEIGAFANQPTLPQGWKWARFECLLSEDLRNGKSAKTAEDGNGIRVLTLTAVTDGEFTLENTKIGDFDEDRVADLWLEPGDILIERSNTEELVGTTRLYKGERNFAIFPDLVIRARVTDALDNRYAELVLRAQRTQSFFHTKARGTSGSMQKINQSIVKDTPIPVPPKAEQSRIVEVAERLLSLADESVETVSTERERAERLRQSILKSAFSGRFNGQTQMKMFKMSGKGQ